MNKPLKVIFLICFLLFISACDVNMIKKFKEKDYKIEYQCDSGYSLKSDKICEKISYSQIKISYTCPSGYVLLNGVCQQEIETTKEIKGTSCDYGYEYESMHNYCRSTKRANAYYEYSCPNGYFEYGNYCWKYFGEDGKYVEDNIHVFCIKGTLTSAGIINPTNYCKYYFRYEMTKSGPFCPVGYGYDSSIITTVNACRSTEWKKVNVILECPAGYYSKSQYSCYKILQTQPIEEQSCEYDYNLQGDLCVKIDYKKPKEKYICPTGYSLNKESKKCIK